MGMAHLHDYIASEMARLTRSGGGTLALCILAGTLIHTKTKLKRTDALPAARLITESLAKTPGCCRCRLVDVNVRGDGRTRGLDNHVWECVRLIAKCQGG